MFMIKSLLDNTENDWQERLDIVVGMMREMSLQTDPQEMVRAYGEKVRQILPSDRRISLSRRGLTAPQYRITRSTTWPQTVDPWREKDRLPVFEGGLLARLIYGDEPKLMDHFEPDAGDPAYEYLAGQRSLLAIPLYDKGVALNMVVLLKEEAAGFSREQFPEMVWLSNLFGRATSNLVLSDELQRAYQTLDREFQVVGEIQRSLLPAELP